MPPDILRNTPVIIDLVSDTDTSDIPSPPPSPTRRRRRFQLPERHRTPAAMKAQPPADELGQLPGDPPGVNPREVIDVDALKQIETPNEQHKQDATTEDAAAVNKLSQELNHNFERCLDQITQVFPRIDPDHVKTLYITFSGASPQERTGEIAQSILEAGGDYPKQEVTKGSSKRKRAGSLEVEDFSKYTAKNRDTLKMPQKNSICSLLVSVFPSLLPAFINKTFAEHRQLFPTYVALSAVALGSVQEGSHRVRPLRTEQNIVPERHYQLARAAGPGIPEELRAAERSVKQIQEEHIAKQQKLDREEENLKRARENNQLVVCHACFDEEIPMNRAIHCNSDEVHFTCFDCAEKYIKATVGEQTTRVLCTGEDCGFGFTTTQLQTLPNQRDVERLERLIQQEDLRLANIDGLEACPFCDFQAILDEGYNHFVCEDCGVHSCRKCKRKDHSPLTCDEFDKKVRLDSRNVMAEKITASLIRYCNKCKTPFIKEDGCNKMTCPKCSNMQCYLCSKDIQDYDHFDKAMNRAPATGQCVMYDKGHNTAQAHYEQTREAEKQARAEAMAKNPELKEQDLQFNIDAPPPQHQRYRAPAMRRVHQRHAAAAQAGPAPQPRIAGPQYGDVMPPNGNPNLQQEYPYEMPQFHFNRAHGVQDPRNYLTLAPRPHHIAHQDGQIPGNQYPGADFHHNAPQGGQIPMNPYPGADFYHNAPQGGQIPMNPYPGANFHHNALPRIDGFDPVADGPMWRQAYNRRLTGIVEMEPEVLAFYNAQNPHRPPYRPLAQRHPVPEAPMPQPRRHRAPIEIGGEPARVIDEDGAARGQQRHVDRNQQQLQEHIGERQQAGRQGVIDDDDDREPLRGGENIVQYNGTDHGVDLLARENGCIIQLGIDIAGRERIEAERRAAEEAEEARRLRHVQAAAARILREQEYRDVQDRYDRAIALQAEADARQAAIHQERRWMDQGYARQAYDADRVAANQARAMLPNHWVHEHPRANDGRENEGASGGAAGGRPGRGFGFGPNHQGHR